MSYHEYSKILLTANDLNIILDGLQDTLIRNEEGELKDEKFDYITSVMILKKRVERELLKFNSRNPTKEKEVSKSE